jgi:hypothetical protein
VAAHVAQAGQSGDARAIAEARAGLELRQRAAATTELALRFGPAADGQL